MTGRNKRFPFVELFSAVSALIAVFTYRNFILDRIGRFFSFVFHKDFYSRSPFFQQIVIFFLCIGIILILILADRILFAKKKERSSTALPVLFSIPAVQTLIICANQILRRDDYWEIADANSYGFPGSMIFEITNHNGRYLSWGIKSLYAFLPPIPFINILLFLNICLLVMGFYLAARQVLTNFSRSDHSGKDILSQALPYAAAITAMIILLSSNVWEVWFWGSGTLVYGLTISLCVISSALVIRIANDTSAKPSIRILAAAACFLACGGSELSTISLAAFLFYLLLWKRVTTKKWNRHILFYVIEVSLCCLGILFLSGSINAAGEFASADVEKNESFFTALPEMLKSIIVSLWRYTTISGGILALFLFVFFMLGIQCRFDRQIRKKLLWISLLLVFTANFILLLNEYIGYSPPRVVTIPLCWIFLALSLICLSAGSLAAEKTGFPSPHRLMLLCCVLPVLSYAVFYTENIDLIRQIRQSWVIRDESLKDDFDRDETIVTCALPSLGSSHNDLEKDPAELYNIAMRMYLRVPAVTAEKNCPPFDQEP